MGECRGSVAVKQKNDGEYPVRARWVLEEMGNSGQFQDLFIGLGDGIAMHEEKRRNGVISIFLL